MKLEIRLELVSDTVNLLVLKTFTLRKFKTDIRRRILTLFSVNERSSSKLPGFQNWYLFQLKLNKKIHEDPVLGQGDDVINYSKLILIAFTPNLNICFK